MSRKFLWLVALLVAVIAVTPVFAGIQGGGLSGVQVQNLSTNSNTVTVQLYPQSGGAAISLPGVTVASESAANFYLPSINNVGAGSYSMVVSANNPVAAIARTDWSASGGAAIYISTAPDKVITIPLATQNFASQTSQISVQNAGAAKVTDVKVEVIARGTGAIVKTLTNQTIEVGASKTYNLGDTGTFGTLPNTGTDLGVATGFVGLVRISSVTNNLVAMSFIDVVGTPGVTGFSGVSQSAASTKLFCPLVRANFYGDTGIQIVNQGSSDANVKITFLADPVSPNQGTFTQNMTVKQNSSDIAFQGPTGNSRNAPTNLPGGTQTGGNTALTNNGFFGSAIVESTNGQSLLAVVNDTEFGANFSTKGAATSNCVPAASAGKKHFLPLLRRFHLANEKLTTGVQVMNITGGSNTISLKLTNWDGTAAPQNPAAVTVGANGAANFYGGSWAGLPTVPGNLGGSGWFGSGVITCSADCIVLVSDESAGSKAVDRANYNGILGQ